MKIFFRIYWIISLIMIYLPVLAQHTDRCGTMPYLEKLKKTNPDIEKRLADNEKNFESYKKIRNISGAVTIRKIPVVVHLIWHEKYQNLCDAVIQSQIDVLNEDYARLNADTTDTPEPFSVLGKDSEIRFILANRDPDGNKSTGIIRTYSDSASFLFGNTMKFDSLGGQNSWDEKKYLNIWVCNLSGSVLGYATLPGTSNTGEDGVVIATKAFGRYSYDPSGKYNLGRTATHEVGHWLNLYHIWGDDGEGCSGSDYVDDTPNQSEATYSCPAFPKKSCGNGPDGDMFMNYMDYTDDRCMNIFSAGQIDRMQYAYDSLREDLFSSTGYVQDTVIKTFQQTTSFLVVPNPFQTSFEIKVRLKKVSDLEIEIYNLMGDLLYEKKFADCFCQNFPVDMHAFPRGIYIARIKSEEETVVTKLFLSK